jgi:DNA-binding protein HU-beta
LLNASIDKQIRQKSIPLSGKSIRKEKIIMNKADIVDRMAAKAGLTKKDAAAALEAFMEAVRDALKAGKSVTLTGFGTYIKSKRQAREGRNPQTGAKIKIPATNVPKFRPGKALREAVK